MAADPSAFVECRLCPKRCKLAENERGNCRVRVNRNGSLRTLVYGKPCAVHIDPVEKKPLFHFLPGTPVFSIATAGCNLHCRFCQNWNISQADPEETRNADLPPEKVVEAALAKGCPSIAYTYTEPVIYFEYTYDCAKLATEKGLKNILVTAGYIEEEPLRELCGVVQAANVDLKSFDERFYKEYCDGTLKPVLKTFEVMHKAGVFVEMTYLIVPTLNDDMGMIREMCAWAKETLSADLPLHFSRFHPDYQLTGLPATPAATLHQAAGIAKEAGLRYVYVGNLPNTSFENTTCPGCGKLLIARSGFDVRETHIKEGRCDSCGQAIHGVWR